MLILSDIVGYRYLIPYIVAVMESRYLVSRAVSTVV